MEPEQHVQRPLGEAEAMEVAATGADEEVPMLSNVLCSSPPQHDDRLSCNPDAKSTRSLQLVEWVSTWGWGRKHARIFSKSNQGQAGREVQVLKEEEVDLPGM